METMPEKTMRAVARNVLQFDTIREHLIRQEFWCAECDHFRVDSHKEETGRFFQVSGHVRTNLYRESLGDTGVYENVIFAICVNCLAKDS